MSDSDLSDAPSVARSLPDSELEQALRKQVRNALNAGDDDASITVASMRKAAEEALGLEPGFYKMNEKWREESKRILHETFDEHGADTSSPAKTKPPNTKPSQFSKIAPPKKRASPSNGERTAKKRRKTQNAVSSAEALPTPPSQLSEEEQPETAPKPNTKNSAKKSTTASKPAMSGKNRQSVPNASETELSDASDEPPNTKMASASDSELSVLIDSEPPPKEKKKGLSTTAEKRASKKPSASKPKADAADAIDPKQAEIKRLQGWLVKCGIRKLWGKELKPYESPKAKIKHLKDMLADAGMSGRYSIEKASQIKEQRELKADIEAVQQGAERWGKQKNGNAEEVDQDSDGRTKPKRRLVRGAQVLDFLSSDGEETD